MRNITYNNPANVTTVFRNRAPEWKILITIHTHSNQVTSIVVDGFETQEVAVAAANVINNDLRMVYDTYTVTPFEAVR